MRAYSFGFRITAWTVIAFFSWTFLSLWEIPAAFAAEKQKPSQMRNEGSRPEEKFEKALEALREHVDKAGKKADTGEDDSAESEAIKAKKNELALLDSELKKEFTETEKRLKSAALPKTILDRHEQFVRRYTDNYTLLRTEIDDIEKAKTRANRKAKIEKARLHLEKTRKKTRHIPIDPNRLPHRTVKAKPKAPRLTPEEYQRDFPKQKSHTKQKLADSHFLRDRLANRPQRKPVLLAFNETASDIPFSISADAITTPPDLSITAFDPLLLAQAAPDLLTEADLGSTPEIQADSPLIRAKAQELGCAPARLYTWTRNAIEFVPTYGSIQGAEMCLQTKQCNAFDTNALLAALFRSCNIPARLSFGTIEVPIEKVMNWAGGFSDPVSALNYIASGGIPITGLRSGGKIYAARLETVWLRVFVDYIPSMGAVHKEGDTFIPLDASFKQYAYSEGVDLQAAVPFDGQVLADQIKATATINEQEGYVTNVDSAIIQTAQNDYNAQLENYIAQNLPNATPGDILGKKEIIKKEQPILPASLPYKVVVAGAEASETPDSLRHKVTIQLVDSDALNTVFTYTISLPELAGKRFTLGYDPATTADQDTINRYVEDYATSIPAYLIQFKPVLKLENVIVATGPAIGMGSAQNLNISLISPRGMEIITHNILAGDYTTIGINPSTISLDALQNRINKNDFSEPVGEMLYQTALSYWAEADAFNDVIAKTLRVNTFRHPSELSASAKISISYFFGIPVSATYNRRNIDVKLDNQTVFSKTADKTKEFNYMQQSGTNSSFLEGAVFDQLFGGNIGDGISAITALKAANDQGIPIYKIDSTNIAATLPKLQLSGDIKNDVSNAVNAGLSVQIPQTNISKSGWTGVGYIALNTTDGTGAYRISGGLNGGDNNTGGDTVIPLPPVPIVGAVTFVVQGFSANSGSNAQVMTTTAGTLIGIKVAGAAVVAVKLLLALILAALIIGAVQYLMDKLPPRYHPYRHYTIYVSAAKIWSSGIVLDSEDWFSGDLILPGTYITDLRIEPDTEANRMFIAEKLRIPRDAPDPNRVTSYVEMLIDINRVGLVSCQLIYPHQYLRPFQPLYNDGVRVKFTGHGPFIPPP